MPRKPLAVTNVVRGDVESQEAFAETIAGGLRHLAVNHNAMPTGERESFQRARSMILIAFGILATTLRRYGEGGEILFYVCENGFIAINPHLTGTRLRHAETVGFTERLIYTNGRRT